MKRIIMYSCPLRKVLQTTTPNCNLQPTNVK
nr:MAG TPA: hypothetical protein [Caudoviricetes sp.]